MLVVQFQTKYCFRIAAAHWVIFCNNQPLMRGQRSSSSLLGLNNPGIRAVVQCFPPLVWHIKAAALGFTAEGFLETLFCLQMHLFFFFALQSVASGIKAQTHTERQMSDLMTVITAKRESSMFSCIRRNKDEWVKYCWPREITVNRLCEVFLQFTWVDVINLKY